MVHRDPETGQFRSHDGDHWTDIEVVTFQADFGRQAADNSGATGFSGESGAGASQELVDYDEIVDRNEELVLLEASHAISVFANSTETADGTVAAVVTVSADPALSDPQTYGLGTGSLSTNIVGASVMDDTIDIIGRPLHAVGHAPFNDSATGVGGAGSAGEDRWQGRMWPMEFSRFHPRDELFAATDIVTWNIDDAAVHAILYGQHVYGVLPAD